MAKNTIERILSEEGFKVTQSEEYNYSIEIANMDPQANVPTAESQAKMLDALPSFVRQPRQNEHVSNQCAENTRYVFNIRDQSCSSTIDIATFSWGDMIDSEGKQKQTEARITKRKEQSKHIAKLVNPEGFSANFNETVGVENTRNVTGLEGMNSKIEIFGAIVEASAKREWRNKSSKMAAFMPPCNMNNYSPPLPVIVGENGGIKWNHKGVWQFVISWVCFISILLNIAYMDAMATLAKWLGLDFKNIFDFDDCQHAAESNRDAIFEGDEIPGTLIFHNHPHEKRIAQCVDRRDVLGNSGQVIGSFVMYKWGNKNFCLPATVGNGILCIGMYKTRAYWLNQHLLDKYPFSVVIVFQDIRVALAIQKRLDSDKSYDPSMFIVTAHLGTDLFVLHWSYLWQHNVVFVPAPTTCSLAIVPAYAYYHRTGKFDEVCFKVASKFILLYRTQNQANDNPTLSKAESDILERCYYIDEIDELPRYLEQVIADAVTTEAFRKKYVRNGVFMPVGDEVSECSTTISILPLPDPALIVANASKLEDAKINHILKHRNIVVVVGEKNAGKTQFGCLLAKSSLNLEKDVWPFCNSVGFPLGNVCIVDGETDGDELIANLKQHGLYEEKDKSLFLVSRLGEDRPEFASDFRLINEEFLNGLRKHLIKHQCRLVILDNMTELMGHWINHDSSAQKVLRWAEELQEIGICVVFLLHKSDEAVDKRLDISGGSQFYKKRARVVINLYGNREIRALKLGSQIVQDSAVKDGLTMGIEFTTCKTAPCLENKTIWLHLPMGASRWEQICLTGIDGKEIAFPRGCGDNDPKIEGSDDVTSSTENALEPMTSEPEDEELGYLEKKLLEAIKELGGDVSISEIMPKIEGKNISDKGTVRKYLKKLCSKNFLKKYKENNTDRFKLIDGNSI